MGDKGVEIEPKVGSRRLGWKISDLDFADDIAIIESTLKELEASTNAVSKKASGTGLIINKAKTHTMKLSKDKAENQTNNTIKINDQEIETVNKFTYLGSIISDDGKLDLEINERIRKASYAYKKQAKVWSNSKVSVKTKMKIYNSTVISTLLYGAESWNITDAQSKRVNAFGMRCLRRILKIKWQEHKTNEEVLKITEQKDILSQIKKRRLNWYGHVKRMDPTRIPQRLLNWNPKGTRTRGKQKQRWLDLVKQDAAEAGFMEMEKFDLVTKNRVKWKLLVAAQ